MEGFRRGAVIYHMQFHAQLRQSPYPVLMAQIQSLCVELRTTKATFSCSFSQGQAHTFSCKDPNSRNPREALWRLPHFILPPDLNYN